MKQRVLVWIALELIFSVCSRGAVVPVTGTTVSLESPKSFSPAREFPGFGNRKLGASIMVTEMPGPSGTAQDGMTKEALGAKGITLIESSKQQVDGRSALLIKVRQEAAGIEFTKYILVAGDERQTTIVTGAFPKQAAKQLESAIKRSLLSAKWETRKLADPFEGLLYKVEPSQKLKVGSRLGNAVVFSESGGSDVLPPGEARFIVGNSVDSIPVTDLPSFSARRAEATATLQEIKQLEARELTVDGLKAFELVAEAKHHETGLGMRLYQVVAVDGKVYFLMQGLVSAERAPEFIPEFRTLTASFRRTNR